MKKMIAMVCIALFMMVGCDSKSTNETGEKSITQSATEAIKKGADATKEVAEKTTNTVTQTTTKAVEKVDKAVIEPVKEVTKEVVDATKQTVQEGVDAVAKGTQDVVNTTKEVVKKGTDTVAKKATKVVKNAINAKDIKAGKALFTPCISCHGPKAKKKALGKSQVIAGWDAQKISDALNGYKNKTYGGPMKTIMYPQASKLTSEQIDQLAAYIASL